MKNNLTLTHGVAKKIKIGVVALVVVTIVATFAGYVIAKSSEPYQVLERVVQDSSAVKAAIGDFKSITLAPFGYSVKYSGPQGWAEFEARLDGTKSAGTLFVKMETNLGVWQIKGSRLNGKEITL